MRAFPIPKSISDTCMPGAKARPWIVTKPCGSTDWLRPAEMVKAGFLHSQDPRRHRRLQRGLEVIVQLMCEQCDRLHRARVAAMRGRVSGCVGVNPKSREKMFCPPPDPQNWSG